MRRPRPPRAAPPATPVEAQITPAATVDEAQPEFSRLSLRYSASLGRAFTVLGGAIDYQPFKHLRVGVRGELGLDLLVGARVLVPLQFAPTRNLTLAIMPGLGFEYMSFGSVFTGPHDPNEYAISPMAVLAANYWLTPRWGLELQVAGSTSCLRIAETGVESPFSWQQGVSVSLGVARSNVP